MTGFTDLSFSLPYAASSCFSSNVFMFLQLVKVKSIVYMLASKTPHARANIAAHKRTMQTEILKATKASLACLDLL